jgi:hypothetical protein
MWKPTLANEFAVERSYSLTEVHAYIADIHLPAWEAHNRALSQIRDGHT